MGWDVIAGIEQDIWVAGSGSDIEREDEQVHAPFGFGIRSSA